MANKNNFKMEAQAPEHFGPWMEAPSEGPGIYHFKGTRTTTNGSIVTINDVVEVIPVEIGRRPSLQVAFFGRWQKYHISQFVGEWRRLRLDFQGDHFR